MAHDINVGQTPLLAAAIDLFNPVSGDIDVTVRVR